MVAAFLKIIIPVLELNDPPVGEGSGGTGGEADAFLVAATHFILYNLSKLCKLNKLLSQ